MKIKITPTRIYIAVLCLIALAAWAANPSFTDFIASQFDTSGNVVKIKSGVLLTNVSEWGPMTASDTITASNGFFSLGTAAGELVLGQGSGTGGIFDYSGATKSNEVVVVNAAGRFVSIPGTSFTNGSPQVWTNDSVAIYPLSPVQSLFLSGVTADWPYSADTNYALFADFTGPTPGQGTAEIQLREKTFPSGAIQSFRIDLTHSGGGAWEAQGAVGLYVINATTNSTVFGQPFTEQSGGIVGIIGEASLSGGDQAQTGEMVGVYGLADGAGINQFGVIGFANSTANIGQTNVGVLGSAGSTSGFSGVYEGGHFEVFGSSTVAPVLEQSVIVVDGRDTGSALITARTNNGTTVMIVSKSGLVTANGFTDNSGTPGSLVAYQGGNRLGATNITTLIQNNFFTNISVTNLTVYDSVVVNTNVTIKGNVTVNNITVTNTVNNFASNYLAGVQTMATNANNTTPDFAVMGSTLSTNNNFKWLPPIHLDTTGKAEQWIITHITNSSGSLITMTAPDNVHVCGGGAMNVTNWTEVRWQYYPPSGPTNCWPSPGY